MSSCTADTLPAMSADFLPMITQPIYALPEAARLARIPSSTLKRWIHGHSRRSSYGEPVFDEPVLRAEPTGVDELTWGEFVEAIYLRAYRGKKIPLPRLRRLVAELREELETPYPLATQKLFVSGRDVFRRVSDDLEASPEKQLAMEQAVVRYLESLKLEFTADGYVIQWRPAEGDGLVLLQPDLSFGAPVVDVGVRTEVLFESFAAGDTIAAIVDGFKVPVEQVEAAIRYETKLGAKIPSESAA